MLHQASLCSPCHASLAYELDLLIKEATLSVFMTLQLGHL